MSALGGRRASAVLHAAAVGALITLLLTASPFGAGEVAADTTPAESMSVVGKLPVAFPEGITDSAKKRTGYLILNPHSRRVYVVSENAPARTVFLQSFDLDRQTFDLDSNPLREHTLEGQALLPGGTGGKSANTSGGETIHALDGTGRRIFLPVGDQQVPPSLWDFGGPDQNRKLTGVLILDEDAFDAGHSAPITELSIPATMEDLPFHSLNGMTYVERGAAGKLVLLLAAPSTNTVETPAGVLHREAYDHYLVQWDIATGQIDWRVLLEECSRAQLRVGTVNPFGRYALGLLHSESDIHLGCQSAIGVGQVVRIPLTTAGAPDPARARQTFVLGRRHSDVLADQAAQRLYFRSTFARGETWWVFDADLGHWVGGIGTALSGPETSAGIDPTTGRFYTLAPHSIWSPTGLPPWFPAQGGFGYSDARLTPSPQINNVMPELAHDGNYRIWVDPEAPGRPRRVFLRRGSASSEISRMYNYPSTTLDDAIEVSHEYFYLVIEDRVPVAVPQPPDNPDLLTTDVDEKEGVTTAVFDAAGLGFGVRVLLTGGLEAVTTQRLDQTSSPWSARSTCTGSDRDIRIGEVERAGLSNAGSAGAATGIQADPDTRADQENPLIKCWPSFADSITDPVEPVAGEEGVLPTLAHEADSNAGEPWGPRDHLAECAGDSEDTNAGDRLGLHLTAHASCRESDQATEASGAGAVGGHLPVSVASASSHAYTRRDPERGIVSLVESFVRGIRIEGLASIGEVRAISEVWAGGRPGTAGSSYTRDVCGVSFPGFEHQGCMGEEALEQFAAQLSARMGTRGDVRLRQPDQELAKGSPGGFQATIRRDRNEEFEDRNINRDRSTAVPALELIFYRDDREKGSGRSILQLAAVQGHATYGIQCLYGEGASGCSKPAAPPAFTDTFEVSQGPPPEARATAIGTQESFEEISEPLPPGTRAAAARTAAPESSSPLRRIVQGAGGAFGFFLRGPREAVLMGASIMLLILPAWLRWRRRALGPAANGSA